MPDWYVGQHVVCILTGYLSLAAAPELRECNVYTIKAIWPAIHGHVGLELTEVRAMPTLRAFDERRFRPVGPATTGCSEARLAGAKQSKG